MSENNAETVKTLSNLKAGDRVILYTSECVFGELVPIEHVTPKGLICVRGEYYNRSGSPRVEPRFDFKRIAYPDPEVIEKIHQRETINEALRMLRAGSITYKAAKLVVDNLYVDNCGYLKEKTEL